MTQRNEQHRKWAWPLGLLLSTLMMGCILLLFSLTYATVDDTLILRQLMGFSVTEIPDFNMCVTFVLYYPLRWLSLAFPGLPWFSWMQLFLLWFASAVISKGILQCFANARRPLWQGLLLAAFFHFVFVLRYEGWVTFTVTAAVLGAAAVMQLLSIDTEHCTNGQWIRSALLSLVLIALSYGMREMSMFPSLAICAAAFIVQGIRRFEAGREWLRPLAVTAVVVVVVVGGMLGIRALEVELKPGIKEYMQWQDARSRVWDFLGVENIPGETLEELGISETHARLLAEWYQMDGLLDLETLTLMGDAIEANRDNSIPAHLSRIGAQLSALMPSDPIAARSFLVLAVMLVSLMVFLLLPGERRSRRAAVWGLLLALVFAAVLTLYLAYKGRLLTRTFVTITLPLAALTAALLPAALPAQLKLSGRGAAALCCAAMLIAGLWYSGPYLERHLRRELTDDELTAEATLAAIDDYATANEDCLLIYENSLSGDTRMFPSTEYGISKNVHYWGGWNAHSPAYNALLESYGFDPDNWSLEDFLSPDVRLLCGTLEPPAVLLEALGELCEVDWYLDSEWDGLYSMYFEEW